MECHLPAESRVGSYSVRILFNGLNFFARFANLRMLRTESGSQLKAGTFLCDLQSDPEQELTQKMVQFEKAAGVLTARILSGQTGCLGCALANRFRLIMEDGSWPHDQVSLKLMARTYPSSEIISNGRGLKYL